MAALRYLLLLAFILTGCAAQGPGGALPVNIPPSDSQPPSSQLLQLRLDQQTLANQVTALAEQVRQLEVRLQAQQVVFAKLSAHPTEMVMGGGQKTEFSPPSVQPDNLATSTRSATDIYLKAFTDYASGRFSEAISGFRLFVERYPENDFASNAQFWLGECYYSQRLLSRALTEFTLAAERYPTGAKTPDALLKMATIYSELNQPELQQQTEARLLELYPQSSAGKKLRSTSVH